MDTQPGDWLQHILGHCMCPDSAQACWYINTWRRLVKENNHDYDTAERLLEPLQEEAILSHESQAVAAELESLDRQSEVIGVGYPIIRAQIIRDRIKHLTPTQDERSGE